MRLLGKPECKIPAQWQHFMPRIGNVPGQVGHTAYGLCFMDKEGVGYLTGVEVSSAAGRPADLDVVSVPAQKYAVFPHRGHVSKLYETLDAIEHQWQPKWGVKAGNTSANGPAFFERYGKGFDPKTGMGDIEVWVPVKA